MDNDPVSHTKGGELTGTVGLTDPEVLAVAPHGSLHSPPPIMLSASHPFCLNAGYKYTGI